jgi:hypothetical protein
MAAPGGIHADTDRLPGAIIEYDSKAWEILQWYTEDTVQCKEFEGAEIIMLNCCEIERNTRLVRPAPTCPDTIPDWVFADVST